jgi:hypothetical protein
MPTPVTLRHGVPRPLPVQIRAGTSGLDMTTVSAVVFRVRSPSGQTVEWPGTLSDQTTSSLVATKSLTAGECPGPGQYSVSPLLTISGQTWPEEAERFTLIVEP